MGGGERETRCVLSQTTVRPPRSPIAGFIAVNGMKQIL